MSTWRKIFSWETTPEPIEPVDYRGWRRLNHVQQNAYIEQLIEELKNAQAADDPSVKKYIGGWSGYSVGEATIWARTPQEALILGRRGQYEDWNEQTGDDYEFEGVEDAITGERYDI